MKSRYVAPRWPLQWAIGPVLLLLTLLAQAQSEPAVAAGLGTRQPDTQQPNVPQPNVPQRTILVLGDSLSAAYGLAPSQGWVALLGERLARSAPGWRVINASISGETTAGGAARAVREVVLHRPDVVIIELGGNDALRGLPLRQTRTNLARMIGAAQGVGAEVLLLGMRIPPNYGSAYTREFERGYRQLAERFDTALLPFFLEPIALDRNAFQPDNLHPVASVQPKLRDHVWTALAPLLDK